MTGPWTDALPGGAAAPQRPRVFISYARRDGEALALQLRERLRAAEIPLWRDRESMEGGRDWWLQITAALDEVEFLVLLMTEGALGSELVRREWRYARQRGVVVYPVLACAGEALAALPRWMRSAHFYDIAREWTKFVNDLQTRPRRVRVPFMAEPLPPDYVARPLLSRQLVAHLVDAAREEPRAVVAALRGAGGFGKTALARAACHDEAVQNAFDDGILWVSLGESPGNLSARVEDLIYMLSGRRPGFAGLEAATAVLVELLADREILIVVDDVWQAAHLEPFLQGGERCARLVTTRNADVLPPHALRLDVEAMAQDEALALLAQGLGTPAAAERSALSALAARLGEWPMLIKLVNAALRERVLAARQPLPAALAYVNTALDRRGLTFFDARDGSARHRAVTQTLELSRSQLTPAEQARLDELAVFPEDATIALEQLERLWGAEGGLDAFNVEALCDRLERLSLVLDFDPAARFVRLHDVVRQYLVGRLGARLPPLHARWLDAARPDGGDWAALAPTDSYAWRWLLHHLRGAGRLDELAHTARSLRWLAAKSVLVSPLAVEADLVLATQVCPQDAALQALRRHYAQCAHIAGRCDTAAEAEDSLRPRLPEAVDDAAASARARLHPRALLPDLPHPALVRTLRGHTGAVLACAIAPDGQWLATAGTDQTVRVYAVADGSERLVLQGHRGWVQCLAFSADGTLLASGGSDRRLRVWELPAGTLRCVLVGHTDGVTGCAFTPDGGTLVSSARDETVRLWDLASASARRTFARRWRLDARAITVSDDTPGHWSAVLAVTCSADGRWIASASSDHTLIVWDAASGQAHRVLAGHGGGVTACDFSADGERLVSASSDGTLRLWHVASGSAEAVLHGHERAVTACRFLPAGDAVLSSSNDGTLRRFALDTGAVTAIYRGHTDAVHATAASGDGCHAATASADGSVKWWDLRVPVPPPAPAAHADWVLACAAQHDAPRLLTASADRSLVLWDDDALVPLHRFAGHDGSVRGCAISGDGRWLASAAADKSVRLWDAASGQLLQLLAGHRDGVNACAFDPAGALLASAAGDRSLRLWDLHTRSRRLAFIAHAQALTSCAFSADGSHLASAAADGCVRLWPLPGDERWWEAWLSRSRPLPLAEALQVLLPRELPPHDGIVHALACDPGGGWLVTAAQDGYLRLWDPATARLLGVLQGHRGAVQGVAVAPDGAHIASVSADGAVKLWRVHDQRCLCTLRVDGELSGCAFGAAGRVTAVGALGVYHLDAAGLDR